MTLLPTVVWSLPGKYFFQFAFLVFKVHDLFGERGDYAHWGSDNMTFSAEIRTIVLEIDLQEMKFYPNNESYLAKTIDSHLKVGLAKAVTQALPIKN